MPTATPFDATKTSALLERLAALHPEHASIIKSFAPLTIARERLLHEYALRRRLKPQLAGSAFLPMAHVPLCARVTAAVCEGVVEALKEGLPEARVHLQAVGERIAATPSVARRLCKAQLCDEGTVLPDYAAKHGLELAVLGLVISQTSQIMTARATRALPPLEGRTSSMTCPYCGSRPDLSVIHAPEGERLLLCSHCGRHWRYSRTACPLCAADEPHNLQHLYAEGSKDERAVICQKCRHYILEVDIRPLDLSPDTCRPLTLALGYLDVLAQDERAVAVSAEPVER